MRNAIPQIGPLLRLALLALMLMGQTVASAHELSHDIDGTPSGDTAQCALCSVGGTSDGALETHLAPVPITRDEPGRPILAAPQPPLERTCSHRSRAPPVRN